MRTQRLLLAATAAALGVLILLSGGAAAQADNSVLVTRVEGPITPVIASHVADAIDEAADGGYEALLVEMDTPGGLEDSMRAIVQRTLTAPVPVIVYVEPAGARAASAGAVIAFSAHVAAMSPGTNIGAATPVALEGGEVIDKVVEDSAAYVQAIAEARDRDVDFAVETVRDGRSAPASEALEVGAVDLIADSRAELLSEVDGETVTLSTTEGAEDEVTLATADAATVDYDMTWTRSIQQTLANPQLALLLLGIAPLAILYEFISPSGGIGAIFGGIMLILGLFSVAVLPVNVAGLVLLLLAAGLFAAELFAPGIGVFAAGGAVAFVLAGLFLFERPTGVFVDLSFLIPIALAVAVVAVFIGRFAVRAHQARRYAGEGGEVVGQEGEVRTVNGSRAQVHLSASTWSARSANGPLRRGDRVRVVEMDGLQLVVEPVDEGASEPEGYRS
jgi:membrane-bound serine protease (ClpP class)